MKSQQLRHLKRRVCSALVLTLLLVQSSFVFGEERQKTGAGLPALFIQDANIYAEASTESTVLKTMQKHQAIKVIAEKGAFYKLDYCNKAGYVLKESVLTHNDLEDYVFKNTNLFSYNVIVTAESTNLIDPGSGTAQVGVTQDERFVVLGEEQYFYTVMYNDRQFLLYKQDAKREYYVKITDFVAINKNESKREQIATFTQEFLGNPYVWGGTSLVSGADCSGFVQSVFKYFQIDLPRSSVQQATVGQSVDKDNASCGDLLFFNRGGTIGHVSIYLGDNKMIEAKGASYGIVISDVNWDSVVVIKNVID